MKKLDWWVARGQLLKLDAPWNKHEVAVYRKDEVDARDKELAGQLEKAIRRCCRNTGKGLWIEVFFHDITELKKVARNVARVLRGET